MDVTIALPKYTYPWLGDIALGYYHAAKDLGKSAEIVGIDSLNEFNRGDVNLILGAHWFAEQEKEGTISFKKPDGAIWVWQQMEQIPHHDSVTETTKWRWDQTVRLMNNFDWILAESPPKVKFLHQQGINSTLLLCGYQPSLEAVLPAVDKKFDVIFYGAITPRRYRIIEKIANETKLSMHVPAHFLWGKDKHMTLKSAKVVLNVHMNELKAFEKPRIVVDGLSNKNFILTETIDHLEGFTPRKHFAMASYDSLIEELAYWVQNDEERDKIIQNGYSHVKTQYNITESLDAVLQTVLG